MFGPIAVKFFMGAQKTSVYRIVIKNPSYDAYFSSFLMRKCVWWPRAPLPSIGLGPPNTNKNLAYRVHLLGQLLSRNHVFLNFQDDDKCVFTVFVLFTPTTLNPTARHIHSDHPHSSHPISNYHFPSASSPSESSKRAMIVDRIRARVEVPSNSAAEDSGDGMETSSNPGSRKRFPSEMNGNIDEKRRKFLERNRAAAQRCREKRKQWINNLQAEKYNIQEENNKLHVRRVIFRFLAFN